LQEWGIRFGTVAPTDVGQRPTFGPESSVLWESSTLTVSRNARRPTAVPKWIPLLQDTDGALCGLLLDGHGDAESFFGGDVVVGVFGVFADIDLNPTDLPIEQRLIDAEIVGDGRGRIASYVCGFVE